MVAKRSYNSRHYEETGQHDLWNNLGVGYDDEKDIVISESEEDGVVLTLDDVIYRIQPKGRKSVKVTKLTRCALVPETSRHISLDSGAHLTAANESGSPTDRELLARCKHLLEYERTTSNAEMVEAVSKARKAPQQVTFTVPRGSTLSRPDRVKLEKLFTKLVEGNLEGALQYLGRIKLQTSDA